MAKHVFPSSEINESEMVLSPKFKEFEKKIKKKLITEKALRAKFSTAKHVLPSSEINESEQSEKLITVKTEKKIEKKLKLKTSEKKGRKIKTMKDLEITKNSVEKALDVILQLAEIEKEEKKTLLPFDEQPIFLQINCIKIPKVSRRRIRLSLPHTMVGPTDEVALFVPDLEKGRRKDFEKTIDHWETILKEKGVTNVNTVIPMNQVKTEYNQYEMRRKLARLHDFFLVDGKIAGHLTHLLGKTFTRFAVPPVPLKLHRENLKDEINNALKNATLEIHGYGPSHTAKIATLSMPPKKIIKNILAAYKQLKEKYPGGIDNIRSILIKTNRSLAIPIYYSIKNRNEVPVPTLKPKRPKAYQVVEGELTTLEDDVKVSVTPAGRVTVTPISPIKVEEVNVEPVVAKQTKIKKEKNNKSIIEKVVKVKKEKVDRLKKKIKKEKA